MFEQDYIMRLIKEMVRVILKLIFQIDVDHPTAELLEEKEDQNTLEDLCGLIDSGEIDEAENRIYDMTSDGNMRNLKVALLFYSYLNEKEDEFLSAHDFSREEVRQGMEALVRRYGMAGIEDVFA